MARIELRNAIIRIKDGLSGTAAVNQTAIPPADGDTQLAVDAVALNTAQTDLIPVGARFTVAGCTGTYTVTARTPSDGTGPTTEITFSPALSTVAGVPADNAVITFLPQQLEVKTGDGNLTYTENKEYNYQLDRGNLDTVREGNQVPLDVTIDFVYEHVTSGTGEPVTVVDALKRKGGAAEWVSSSTDLCEPYAVDLEVEHKPPCGQTSTEITLFPDFRYDSLEFNLSDATISTKGRCNASEPSVSRQAAAA
jgi:hypothetical protein